MAWDTLDAMRALDESDWSMLEGALVMYAASLRAQGRMISAGHFDELAAKIVRIREASANA